MNTKLDKILAEISAGELIDKITILEIKKVKIQDKNKLLEIEKELLSLNNTTKEFIKDISMIANFKDQLKDINIKLWDIEDGKRLAEKKNDFGEEFTEDVSERVDIAAEEVEVEVKAKPKAKTARAGRVDHRGWAGPPGPFDICGSPLYPTYLMLHILHIQQVWRWGGGGDPPVQAPGRCLTGGTNTYTMMSGGPG